LPDGIFPNKKFPFGLILDDLAMEVVGILFGHLVYLMAIWYCLGPCGIFYGYFVYLFLFWYIVPGKIWQPCREVGNLFFKTETASLEKKS
jgi:hypothetical protein